MSNEDLKPSAQPYGDAMTAAAQSGNLEDMEAHADAVRRAIAGEPPPENAKVKFEKVLERDLAAVRGVLHGLEAKIADMRNRKG